MRAQYKPCIIFSVDVGDYDHKVNVMARYQAENDMIRMGIKFETVLGVYNGIEETSYIVTDMSKVPIILGMAKEFYQESVLLRDNENNCTLKFFDGRPMQSIGKLNEVSVEQAMASNAYTYSYSLKKYFVCS